MDSVPTLCVDSSRQELQHGGVYVRTHTVETARRGCPVTDSGERCPFPLRVGLYFFRRLCFALCATKPADTRGHITHHRPLGLQALFRLRLVCRELDTAPST